MKKNPCYFNMTSSGTGVAVQGQQCVTWRENTNDAKAGFTVMLTASGDRNEETREEMFNGKDPKLYKALRFPEKDHPPLS